MIAPTVFGAGLFTGCGVLLAQHVRQDAQEQQNVREMTAHLMAAQRAYINTAAAIARAAVKQQQALLCTLPEDAQQTEPASDPFPRLQ